MNHGQLPPRNRVVVLGVDRKARWAGGGWLAVVCRPPATAIRVRPTVNHGGAARSKVISGKLPKNKGKMCPTEFCRA